MKTLKQVVLGAVLIIVSGCRSQVQHGLEERDANEIVSVLVGRGFDVQKVAEKGKKPTWAIELDDDHVTDALRVLTELKLPRRQRTTTKDLTTQGGLIETPAVERLRQLEGEEGDIEQALETMDGVVSADVELVVPPPPRPGQPASPSKAAVLVRVTQDSLERFEQQRASLRALVAASVEGLKPDDVVLHIDPVAQQVVLAAPPSQEKGLRGLAVGLGLVSSLLACGLVVAATLLRRRRSAPAAKALATSQPVQTPSRPIVSPAVQRKVA